MSRGAARLGPALAVLLLFACSSPVKVRELPVLEPGTPSFFATLAAHTDARFVGGNRVEPLLDGDGTFPVLLDAVKSAKRSVTLEQYIYDRGAIVEELTAALAERCRAGVRVHLLLDAFGSSALPRERVRELEDAGCELAWFGVPQLIQLIPPWRLLSLNNRNHQRIVVVDGEIGFTGGFGVSETWTGNGRDPERWRETNVRFEGPVVQQLQAAFVQDWREATGVTLGGADYFPPLDLRGGAIAQVVKSSPTSGASESYMMFLFAITTARESIYITNPYFLVDGEMEQALADAVARGVEVVLLIPGRVGYALLGLETSLVQHAGRQGLGSLLEAGIRVFEYQPARLHAKTVVVDRSWATIGSTNLDPRSFALNKELNLTVYDAQLAERLAAVFQADLQLSHELTYAAWQQRGLADRLLELFAVPAKSQL